MNDRVSIFYPNTMNTLDRVPLEASLFKARSGSLGMGLLLFIRRLMVPIANKTDPINLSQLFYHNPDRNNVVNECICFDVFL